MYLQLNVQCRKSLIVAAERSDKSKIDCVKGFLSDDDWRQCQACVGDKKCADLVKQMPKVGMQVDKGTLTSIFGAPKGECDLRQDRHLNGRASRMMEPRDALSLSFMATQKVPSGTKWRVDDQDTDGFKCRCTK